MNHASTIIETLAALCDGNSAPAAGTPEFLAIQAAFSYFNDRSTSYIQHERLSCLCLQLLASRLEGGLHAQLALDQMRQEGRTPC